MRDGSYLDPLLAGLLAAAVLVFAAVQSHRAPCGGWINEIFETRAWGEADPGAWYLFKAYELGRDAAPFYHGHPGTPLLLLLSGIERAYYTVEAPSDAVPRARFTAQNLPAVFWLAKLAMTLLHLLSFAALYAMARAMLRERRAAFLATLAYGTSLPVLYYLSRISPEPLVVLFLALSLLAHWRFEQRAVEVRVAGALAYAGLAGVAAISGAVSKLQLLGPLPVFLAVAVASDFPRRLDGPPLAWRVRGFALAAFVAACGASLAFYSQWIQWRSFFAYWLRLPSVRTGIAAEGWRSFLPGLSASNLFPTAELSFAVLCVAGLLLVLRRRELRSRALTVAVLGAFGLGIFAFRVAIGGSFLPFHYAFLALAAAAPFCGAALAALESRLGFDHSGVARVAFALIAIALVHGLGVAAVVDSRAHDVRSFAPNRPAFELIAQVDADEQIVLESRGPMQPEKRRARISRLIGWPSSGLVGVGGSTPELVSAFDALFTLLPVGRVGGEPPRVFVPSLDADLVRVSR